MISAGTQQKLEAVRAVPLIADLAGKMNLSITDGKENEHDKGDGNDGTAELEPSGIAGQ